MSEQVFKRWINIRIVSPPPKKYKTTPQESFLKYGFYDLGGL